MEFEDMLVQKGSFKNSNVSILKDIFRIQYKCQKFRDQLKKANKYMFSN